MYELVFVGYGKCGCLWWCFSWEGDRIVGFIWGWFVFVWMCLQGLYIDWDVGCVLLGDWDGGDFVWVFCVCVSKCVFYIVCIINSGWGCMTASFYRISSSEC